MDIRSALTEIVRLQKTIAITAPISQTIANAYNYAPGGNKSIEPPCFLNTWTMNPEERKPSGLRKQHFTVNMQLFCDDADLDRAADIATAYLVKIVDAFDAELGLKGPNASPACTIQTLRGGSPTLVSLTYAGKAYTGLNLFLEVFIEEGVTTFAL